MFNALLKEPAGWRLGKQIGSLLDQSSQFLRVFLLQFNPNKMNQHFQSRIMRGTVLRNAQRDARALTAPLIEWSRLPAVRLLPRRTYRQ